MPKNSYGYRIRIKSHCEDFFLKPHSSKQPRKTSDSPICGWETQFLAPTGRVPMKKQGTLNTGISIAPYLGIWWTSSKKSQSNESNSSLKFSINQGIFSRLNTLLWSNMAMDNYWWLFERSLQDSKMSQPVSVPGWVSECHSENHYDVNDS